MKKCPACGKEFEDSMKFCQIDGAELVTDEPAFDPYATVVGHKLDLTPEPDKPAGTPVEEVVIEPIEEASIEMSADTAEDPVIGETTGSVPIAEPDEVLELPGIDPLKTMYVSESELKEVFGSEAAEESTETPTLESIPEASAAETPGFGEMSTPPSPFSMPETPLDPPSDERSHFAEAETVVADEPRSPFQTPEPAPVAEWNPPPAPEPAWQKQQAGSNIAIQANAEGQSKGLAVGSLVCGILSCTICCWFGILLGPAGIVMGLMAKKKADEDPSQFGGRGLALGGMITGIVGLLVGIAFLIYQIFMGGLALLMGGM